MADPNDPKTEGAPPRSVHVEDKKSTSWLPWLALAAGLLALLFALSQCKRDETRTETVTTNTTALEPITTTASTGPYYTTGLGDYLAGTDAVPRTFAFEKLNFDTGKSVIRPDNRDEVDAAAATLKTYGNSRIRVDGYADARGTDAANMALGKARADAVKAALVAKGIAASRIETATGGETGAVDSNSTTSGQAENRRTELVVLTR